MMKPGYCLILVLVVLGLVACSPSTPDYRKQETPRASPSSNRPRQADSSSGTALKEVHFDGEVITGEPVRLRLLGDDGNLFEPDYREDLKVVYNWSRDKAPLDDPDSSTLPAGYVAAGDWIRCQVQVIDSSGRILKAVTTPLVEVRAYPPALDLSAVVMPEIPGVFTYRIIARDDPRNYPRSPGTTGELKYELLDPRPEGIRLDSATGEITWPLTPEVIEGLQESRVTLRFRVQNAFGSGAEGEITLRFRSRTETRETVEEQ